ncbi:MAG: acyl-CoA reductase [Bacteroidia bacterium]|nr:acyl-CoA reductase [Bacteroidia bacterium]
MFILKDKRLNALIEAGLMLKRLLDEYKSGNYRSGYLHEILEQSAIENPWFTGENVLHALDGIVNDLSAETLQKWAGQYPELNIENPGKEIGVIMAGNIPLVGWRDMLCILLSGNRLRAKLSSKDKVLMKFISSLIISSYPELEQNIYFEDEGLTHFDAIIATGSNNSARYFDYYFGKYPHIIRKNRNSIAVIGKDEPVFHLELLARDIFTYFGLGCRNVSKIYVPEGYNFDSFFNAMEAYRFVINHNKYANNYEYNKAIYLVNRQEHLDNGFLLLTENQGLSSPVGVLYYEYYNDSRQIAYLIESQINNIQCVVSLQPYLNNSINFGSSQMPGLDDYADNADVLKFLINLQ